ncbi:MAG: hypothetical protein HGA37_12255 [Lentimicrobium sp.]|nr:hypothetical protein [Lentimicrobium sp.]
MRLLSITVLISLLLAQPLSLSWIYVTFKLNQASIAKTLCVQKDVKGNKCKGCCQLKKKLKKSDQPQQRDLPKGQRIKVESPFCSRHLQTRDNSLVPKEKKETYFIRNIWIENPSVIIEIFHPPKFTGYKA